MVGTSCARRAALETKPANPKTTARNSAVLPAQDGKANRRPQPGKRRGAKAGPVSPSRQKSEPDGVSDCRAAVCSQCGADLREAAQDLVAELKPEVIELRRYRARGVGGHGEAGRYPPGYDAPQQGVGPPVPAWLRSLNGTPPIARHRRKPFRDDGWGLPLRPGAIVNRVQRTAPRMASAA